MIENLEFLVDKECRFCNQPDKDRILHETDNFYIMLSLGPIVEGYLLLVSKKHFHCCASLPENLAEEFDMLYNKIQNILRAVYGNVLSYEHGRAGSCLKSIRGSKHCYHAHMHFVPVSVKLNAVVTKDFTPVQLMNLNDFRMKYKKNLEPYLFVDDGIQAMYPPNGDLRRQYLRFKVAESLGFNELWDWVKHQNWEVIRKGKLNLLKEFSKY